MVNQRSAVQHMLQFAGSPAMTGGKSLHIGRFSVVLLSSLQNRQTYMMGSYTTRTGITPFCRQ